MSDSNLKDGAPLKAPGMTKYLLLGAVFALLAGSNGYLLWRVNRLAADVSDWRSSVTTEISEIRDNSTAGASTAQHNVESLREELSAARRQAAKAVGRATTDAEKHAERLAAKLTEQQQKQQEVETELTGVKESAITANAKIADVSSEVAATKSELSSAVSDLKRVTGDMGVMSGLIATNAGELAKLKELGERNYFEFNLTKTKWPQKVGDISMLVKKTDPKRNKYTVEILADDKKVEKKDKNSNEPVQFYAAKARQPYELVVNEVKSDRVIGYLATPKVQMARK